MEIWDFWIMGLGILRFCDFVIWDIVIWDFWIWDLGFGNLFILRFLGFWDFGIFGFVILGFGNFEKNLTGDHILLLYLRGYFDSCYCYWMPEIILAKFLG